MLVGLNVGRVESYSRAEPMAGDFPCLGQRVHFAGGNAEQLPGFGGFQHAHRLLPPPIQRFRHQQQEPRQSGAEFTDIFPEAAERLGNLPRNAIHGRPVLRPALRVCAKIVCGAHFDPSPAGHS